MKKTLRLIPILLIAAMLLTGCGMITTSGNTAGTVNTVGSGSASANTASAVTTGSEASSAAGDTASTAFSKRDLSGEYDTEDAVYITLTGDTATEDSDFVTVEGSIVTVTGAGTYILSGTLNGSIIVNASKDDKVQLVLAGVEISSDTFAAIYVSQADKVFVTLAEGTENTLSNGGSFTQIDDHNVDAVIFSRDDLTLNGSGSLTIISPAGHGIAGKDEVVITGGAYTITASNHAIQAKDSIAISGGSFTLNARKDGLHAENDEDDTLGNILITGGSFVISVSDDAVHAEALLQIDGGSLTITAAEGLEATYIIINDGEINITASDDGINAAKKSTAYTPTFEMNGGTVTISMGQGDTDGVDSNGNIVINGGTISVTGNSTFDYDGTAQYNGGTVIVNGQKVTTIPNQMMGGGFGGGSGGFGGFGGGGRH